jgi:hypothetical protein
LKGAETLTSVQILIFLNQQHSCSGGRGGGRLRQDKNLQLYANNALDPKKKNANFLSGPGGNASIAKKLREDQEKVVIKHLKEKN